MRLGGTKATAIHQYRGLGNQLYDLAGSRPSLDLRFADSKSLVDATTGQNLVTFTRASGATYVDSQGVIRNAVTNLLLRSEEFDNASWTKSNSSVSADATASPNGTATADRLIEDSANATHFVRQNITSVVGSIYTSSVCLKAAERNLAVLIHYDGSAFAGVSVNLSTGVVSAPPVDLSLTDATANSSITSLGNGWYRVSITRTQVSTTTTQLRVTIQNGANGSYTGDGTSGIYLWGAQLEQSSTVGEYVPTGATINSAPRFDHNPVTGESLGLLVEEARSNLLLNSGTLATQNVTVTAVAHTLSFTGTGTITLSGTSTAGPLVGTGTGEANRVSLTFTPTAGTLTLTVSGTVTNAQLEIGSFRTSYIPTTTAAATRSADVASISGSNFSSWYRQDEGTIWADLIGQSVRTTLSFDRYLSINGADTGADDINFATQTASGGGAQNKILGNVVTGGTSQAALVVPGGGPDFGGKMAMALAANNVAFTIAGLTPAEDNSVVLPIATQLQIMGVSRFQPKGNGRVKRIVYWPARLPNSTLQAITL